MKRIISLSAGLLLSFSALAFESNSLDTNSDAVALGIVTNVAQAQGRTGVFTNGTYYGNGVGITNSSVTYLTNFTFNVKGTNNTTLSATWRIPVLVSEPATTVGSAESQAQVNGGGAAYYTIDNAAIQGGATSILQTNKETLVFEVPPGWGYIVTNITVGTGYVATNNSAATNEVTFHP
jgi:hypothetical protein